MTAGTLLPTFTGVSFLPENLMPVCRPELRLQGQDSLYEPVAINTAIVNRVVGRVDNPAKAIIQYTGAVTPVGTFFSCQLSDASDDFFIVLHHETGPLCFSWAAE